MSAAPVEGGRPEATADLLALWTDYLRTVMRRRETVSSYLSTVRRFSDWLGRDVLTATVTDLDAWLSEVSVEATRLGYRSHLAGFWAWLVRTDRARRNIVHDLMPPQTPPITSLDHLVPDAVGNLWETLAAWRLAQLAAGCSEGTVRFRARNVRAFGRWAGTDPRFATHEDVVAYLARPTSRTSRAVYAELLRTWFTYLVDSRVIPTSPMAGMRLPRRAPGAPHPISESDLARALAAAAERPDTHFEAFLLLGAFQGLRCLEIARMHGRDIDLTAGSLRVIGKGDVDAVLPLHPLVADLARRYPRRSYWFPSRANRSGHLTAGTVTTSVSEFFGGLGIDATAHDLRHRYGTQVLRASGGNLRTAQELLRHASVATTAVYTRVSSSEREAAVLALPVPEATQ